MKLEKIVTVDGRISISIDDKNIDFELSRTLTGTTGELDVGVFNKSTQETFEFGEFKSVIVFGSNFDDTWFVGEIAKIISERIVKVRRWVADCLSTAGVVDITDKVSLVDKK